MRHGVGKKVIMVMLDGFGVPPEGWRASVYGRYCPPRFIELLEQRSIPLDACLGVPGIPQSATGQTSLFCGVNAQAYMGRHVHAFPGKKLRELIRRRNIFKSVIQSGGSSVFANAYVRRGLEELAKTRFRSVTTVMTAAALGKVLGREELSRGRALLHDITNVSLSGEFGIPVISPELAAENLVNLASDYDFTLFEYFMTDRAGHKTSRHLLPQVLEDVGRFVAHLSGLLGEGMVLLLSSDHGNCEDMETHIHTRNPVPLLLTGGGDVEYLSIDAIDQVHDLALDILGMHA